MGKRHVPLLLAPRVRLRLLEEQDLPRTLAWRNQDHIRRWFFFSQPLTAEQHASWFARYQQRDDDFVFIIEDESSEPIGQVAIYNVDWSARTAEFGRLMIGKAEAAGHGLAREATAAVCALALDQLGLREVYLEVIPDNLRAIRVYEACGFEVTGRTEKAVRMNLRTAHNHHSCLATDGTRMEHGKVM